MERLHDAWYGPKPKAGAADVVTERLGQTMVDPRTGEVRYLQRSGRDVRLLEAFSGVDPSVRRELFGADVDAFEAVEMWKEREAQARAKESAADRMLQEQVLAQHKITMADNQNKILLAQGQALALENKIKEGMWDAEQSRRVTPFMQALGTMGVDLGAVVQGAVKEGLAAGHTPEQITATTQGLMAGFLGMAGTFYPDLIAGAGGGEGGEGGAGGPGGEAQRFMDRAKPKVGDEGEVPVKAKKPSRDERALLAAELTSAIARGDKTVLIGGEEVSVAPYAARMQAGGRDVVLPEDLTERGGAPNAEAGLAQEAWRLGYRGAGEHKVHRSAKQRAAFREKQGALAETLLGQAALRLLKEVGVEDLLKTYDRPDLSYEEQETFAAAKRALRKRALDKAGQKEHSPLGLALGVMLDM